MSPTKVRRVVDLVRGMDVEDALNTLQFAPQAASEPVYKVIASAASNAEQTDNLRRADLYVSQAFVDEGVTMRRIRPRAKGSCQPDPQALQPHHRRRRAPLSSATRGSNHRRRREHGSEDQPVRLPPRHQHRPQEPLVRREALQRLHRRGRQDPPAADQGPGAGRHLLGRDRADPRPGPRRHLHRAAGHRHRPQRCRGRTGPRRPGEADRQAGPAEHPRGQEPRDRRQLVAQGVAEQLASGCSSAGRCQGAAERDARRRAGHPDPVLGSSRRRRDEPVGVLPRGSGAAAHAAGRHRLRVPRGQDHLRPDRREGLDLQGRRVRHPDRTGRAEGGPQRRQAGVRPAVRRGDRPARGSSRTRRAGVAPTRARAGRASRS